MFEFITISNGVAVVQHTPSGYVYRFRPVHPGLWSMLTLDRVDATDPLGASPDDHLGAAQVFAEDVAFSICRGAATDAHVAAPTDWAPQRCIPWFVARLALN